VIAAIDYNHYCVLLDNNEVKECYSNSLRFEAATASLPPNLPPLPQIGANPEEEPDPDHPEGSDNENLEHLPPPEQAEEVADEAEAEVAKAKDAEAEGGQQLSAGEGAGGRHPLPIGQLPHIAKSNPHDYHERKRLAEEKIRGLLANQVTIRQGNNSIVWTVVSDYCNPNCLMEENGPGGLKNIEDIRCLLSSIQLCKIFLKLFLGDSLYSRVQGMNEYIWSQRSSKCKVFTETEFIVGLGLIIGAAEFVQQGKELFINSDKKDLEDDGDLYLSSMVPHPNFQQVVEYFFLFPIAI
jgi:hypothetical protein